MQKLKERHTNTPTNTSLVRSNCDSVIKHGRDQVLQNIKTSFNNSEENQQSGRTEHNLSVYVINLQKKPLMPCCPGKARRLLKENEAKVVSRKPFTIQLLKIRGTALQPITLGIDAGYKYVGFSAKTDKKELISGEVKLRTDIPKKLQEKAMYRRKRRGRLWHRPPRFDNRGRTDGWLAPSIQHKLDSHLRIVEKIKKLLPITETIVEVASFDIQKIKNPDIEGKEYQQGKQLGFWNVREYVLHRDNHTCQHCKGKKKDKILQVHHVNSKAEGATDRPEELLTVCKTCHKEHHKGIDIIPKKRVKRFRHETFMTTVRWKIVNVLSCEHTYGYITKTNRIKQVLIKSHVNDAFIIAGGTVQDRCKPYITKQVRRNNRCVQLNRKGFGRSIRKQRYGLQPNDIVKYNGKEHCVKGVHCKGSRVLLDIKKSIAIKKVELIYYGKGLFAPISPLVETSGFLEGVL